MRCHFDFHRPFLVVVVIIVPAFGTNSSTRDTSDRHPPVHQSCVHNKASPEDFAVRLVISESALLRPACLSACQISSSTWPAVEDAMQACPRSCSAQHTWRSWVDCSKPPIPIFTLFFFLSGPPHGRCEHRRAKHKHKQKVNNPSREFSTASVRECCPCCGPQG